MTLPLDTIHEIIKFIDPFNSKKTYWTLCLVSKDWYSFVQLLLTKRHRLELTHQKAIALATKDIIHLIDGIYSDSFYQYTFKNATQRTYFETYRMDNGYGIGTDHSIYPILRDQFQTFTRSISKYFTRIHIDSFELRREWQQYWLPIYGFQKDFTFTYSNSLLDVEEIWNIYYKYTDDPSDSIRLKWGKHLANHLNLYSLLETIKKTPAKKYCKLLFIS